MSARPAPCVAVRHCTRYRYASPVSLSAQEIRLRPAPYGRTRITDYSLVITPPENDTRWYHDAYGNHVAQVTLEHLVDDFRIDVQFHARLDPINPFDFLVAPHATHYPFEYEHAEHHALLPFFDRECAEGPLAQWITRMRHDLLAVPRSTVDFVVHVNKRVADAIRYETREAAGVQTPEQTLALGCGSCRDSTWLLVHALRQFGIAARFTAGYLVQLERDKDAPPDDARGAPVTHDSVAYHAWCEAYLPGAGWIGFDATSGLATAEGHIPLASAAEPEGAAPVTGYAGPAHAELSFTTDVSRIDHGG